MKRNISLKKKMDGLTSTKSSPGKKSVPSKAKKSLMDGKEPSKKDGTTKSGVKSTSSPKKFTNFGPRIKKARGISQIAFLYGNMKVFAAAVKNFDFEADQRFYAAYVEGRLEDARKIALGRFERASKAHARVLTGKPWAEALKAYHDARGTWSKKNPLTDYPRFLKRVDKKTRIAYFSKHRPAKVENPFGSESDNKSPFDDDDLTPPKKAAKVRKAKSVKRR